MKKCPRRAAPAALGRKIRFSGTDRAGLLMWTVLGGLLLALICCWYYGRICRLGEPFNTIFSAAASVLSDFSDTWSVMRAPYEEVSYGRNYFPALYVLMRLFSLDARLSMYHTFCLLMLLAAAATLLLPFLVARLHGMPVHLGTLLIPFASFGFLFMIDRGNAEVIVYLLMCGFFAAFLLERHGWAAFFLALATCCKLYPGIFVLLLLQKKRYKAVGLFAAESALVFALSMALCGALNAQSLSNLVANMRVFTDLFVLRDWQSFNHSLFGAVKSVLRALIQDGAAYEQAKHTAFAIYTACVALLAPLLAIYVLRAEKAQWKRVLALSIMLVSFPHTSFDYTLVYLTFPILLFAYDERPERFGGLFAVLLGACIVPLNFYYLKSQPGIGVYVVLRPLLLVVLLCLQVIPAVRDVFANPLKRMDSASRVKV